MPYATEWIVDCPDGQECAPSDTAWHRWWRIVSRLVLLIAASNSICFLSAQVTTAAGENIIGVQARGLRLIEEKGLVNADRLADSLLVAGGAREMVHLGTWLRGMVLRKRGDAAAAFKSLDTLDISSQAHPLIRYSIAFEKAIDLKELDLYELALAGLVEAMGIAQAKSMEKEMVDCLTLRSEVYRRQGAYDRSLIDLVEAEKRAERIGYHRGTCAVLINRGNVLYYQEGREREALEQYERALALAQQKGFKDKARRVMKNIGSIRSKLEGPAAAVEFYREALRMNRADPDRDFEARTLASIGSMLNKQKDYAGARKELTEAIRIQEALNDTLARIQSYHYLASTYGGEQIYDSAVAITGRTIELASATGLVELQVEAEWKMTELLREMGHHEAAMPHYDAYMALQDSLNAVKNGRLIIATEIQYETEKKQQTIKLQALELDRTQAGKRAADVQRNIVGAALLALLLLGALTYRNMRQKQVLTEQRQEISEHKVEQVLRDQELRVVDAVMQGQELERVRIARDLHDRVGSLLSAVKMQFGALEGRIEKVQATAGEQYKRVTDLLDTAVGEVRRISHDMEHGNLATFGLATALEDLRDAVHVPGKLEVELNTFGLTDRLDKRLEVAAYRMVQEAVSNALKHAKADHLSIQATRSEALLNLMVEDDGTGFDPEKADGGMGMSNLRSRAAEFNGSVRIDSLPGRGTTVMIDLPLPKKNP